jgi:signal transduction histidine kinase
LLVDGVLAVVLGMLSLAEMARMPASGSLERPPDAVAYALVVLMCTPLAVRRRTPRVAVAIMLVAMLGIVLGGYSQTMLGTPALIALFTLGSRCDLRRSAPLLGGMATLLVISGISSRDPVTAGDVVLVTLSLAVAWGLGASVRIRSAHAKALEERTRLLEERTAELERARRDLARHAVVQERLRIARELHDVVAHSMTVVAVQSGMAVHVLATQPERARAALDGIAASSRAALFEMRQLLGVLRQEDEPTGALAPAPGLADLDGLAAHVRQAGLTLEITIDGQQRVLPAAVDLTAYRIVQEALTNVVKHAGRGAAARVTVRFDPWQLAVEVVDRDGSPATGADDGGSGLVGMRERVAAFGGRLQVGPTPGGFRVAASLPLPETVP